MKELYPYEKQSKVVFKYLLPLILLSLVGCGKSGQSAIDKCIDSKAYLWNPKINDNRYEGNETYWNAVRRCEDNPGGAK